MVIEKMEGVSVMENNNVQEFFDLLDVDSIEEFDSCESGFLAKKYFLLNWILS